MKMGKVVAIILNYNSSRDCSKCVEYLKKQDYEELEVVVVDNASTHEGEIERLRRVCMENNVELLLNMSNRGYSAGNNVGIKRAIECGAEWCLIINPDVELRDNSYIRMVMNLVKEWSDVAIIGSNVVLPSGAWQNPQRESGFWEDLCWPFQVIKSKIDKKSNRYLCDRKTGYCEKVCGACFFISSETVKRIGYLDEGVFMYSEEAILSAQIKKIGKKVLYINDITAYHEHYAAKKELASTRMVQFIESRLYYYKKFSEYTTVQKVLLRISLNFEKIYWKSRGSKFWKRED